MPLTLRNEQAGAAIKRLLAVSVPLFLAFQFVGQRIGAIDLAQAFEHGG